MILSLPNGSPLLGSQLADFPHI